MGYNDEIIDIFAWKNDGTTNNPNLGEGKIGFSQMTPLIEEYNNLIIGEVEGISR